MLIKLQANTQSAGIPEIQEDQNDIIFSNVGGKPTMSYKAKNIPPMEHEDIPTELQVRETPDSTGYTQILNYNKPCQMQQACSEEIPMFRFQVIYDGYDFLYYPEFKLYERPYLILQNNYDTAEMTLEFTSPENDLKNLTKLKNGTVLYFPDYNDEYVVQSLSYTGTTYTVIVDRVFDRDYYVHDIVVLKTDKYIDIADSNIVNDGLNTKSPFKFKFIDITNTNSKSYKLESDTGQSSATGQLYNDDFVNIMDIWGDNRYVSISKNVDVSPSVIVLDSNVSQIDTQITFNIDITNDIDLYSYITLTDSSNLEICKVTEIVTPTTVTVERGMFGTSQNDFTTASTDIYTPKYQYFMLLPFNKHLDKRYVLYRNLDFVLTWV